MAAASASRYAEDIMDTRVKVVVYGDTLMLAGLRASLARYAALELFRLDPALDTARTLDALQPDVIIFDVTATPFTSLPLLNDVQAGVLLLGVDPALQQVLVWSGQHLPASSVYDLVELIGSVFGRPPTGGKQ